MAKKMRGIAVFDLEIDGDYSVVADIEKSLQQWAMDWQKHHDNEKGGIKVIAQQAALTDRRGSKTGPVEKIIFRN